jgi:PAS domain S-box-containing protein
MNKLNYDVLDLLPDEIYIRNKDYEVVFGNKALIDLIGDDFIGKKCYKAILGESNVCECCLFKNSQDTNYSLMNEVQYLKHNMVRSVRRIALSNTETMTLMTSTLETKKIETVLSDFIKKQDQLEEMTKFGHWELDIVKNQLFWSNEIYRIFEIDKSTFEATYEAFLNFIHPEDRALVNTKYQESLITREPYEIVHRLLLADEKIKYVKEKCSTTFDEEGDPIISFGMVSDITEYTLAKNEIKKSEETFKKLVELMPGPVLITDSRGIIVDVNQSFIDLYGHSKSDMIGENPRVLNVGKKIYEELGHEKSYYDSLFKDLWDSIRNIDKGTWTGTVINKDSKGKLMWVELKINTLFDQFGKVIYYIGQPVDVSRYRLKETMTKIEFYKIIAAMSEVRDNETGEHMKRVGITARLLAKQIGMSQKYCEDIEIFAPMHDIGKLGIPDTILLAPRKLTQEEFTLMKQHTIIGNQIISGSSELTMAAEIALSHHERWDGTGYPKSIKGEEIPLHARITILADVYDALRSKRPYKDKWTHEKAVEEILRNKGKMFDPNVVECFFQIEENIILLYENM